MKRSIITLYCLLLFVVCISAHSADRYVVVDSLGQVLTERIYQNISPFINGYAKVERNDRYGLIDLTGKEVISSIYEEIGTVSDDRVIVMKNQRYGVLDMNEKVIIPFEHLKLLAYHPGYYWAHKAFTFGVFDKNGELTVPFSANLLMPFSGGKGYLLATKVRTGEYRLIDSQNKVMLFDPNQGICDFNNGYIGIWKRQPDENPNDRVYSILDSNLQVVNKSLVLPVTSLFTDGNRRIVSDDKIGIVNVKGETLIPAIYDQVYDFKNGYAKVSLDSTRFGQNRYGMVDAKGQEIIECKYNGLGDFSDNRVVAWNAGRFGYLNEKGRVAIAFDYSSASDFMDKMAIVSQQNLYGVIDVNGRVILPLQYQQIRYLKNSLFAAQTNLIWQIIDVQKMNLLSIECEAVGALFDSRYLTVKKDGKWGVINLAREIVLPFKYSEIVDCNNGSFVVRQ